MKIKVDERKRIIEILKNENSWEEEKFTPGETLIRYSGAVFDEKESCAFIDSFLDGWFGLGKKAKEFEKETASYVGQKHGLFTNSGSSANLLAVAGLTSRKFKNGLKEGDEVITSAFCFPTTITPILVNNLIPVFVDSEIGSYTINPEKIKEALTKKTRAIMLTHHLGNPNKLDEILNICDKNGLFLIEDCCDGLGSEYNGRKIGSYGIASTFSFYPAHHITTGEGGMLLSNSLDLIRAAQSIRDWGRDCFCDSRSEKVNGECGERFTGKFGDLPEGYDHKYIYGEKGFNLKPLEFQAAFGLEQMKKLKEFCKIRENNFQILNNFFQNYKDFFILPKTVDEKSKPIWFAYPLTINTEKFSREDIVKYLEKNKIQTRPFFSGNILRHPVFANNPSLDNKYKVQGDLNNSNKITKNSFFLGVYPGIDQPRIDYMIEILDKFLKNYRE